MRRWLPTSVTLLGAILGFVAALLYPCHSFVGLALLSLGCDALDGPLARGLDEVSEFGGALDWSVDCALAHVFLWRAFPERAPELSLVLAIVQAFTRQSGATVVGDFSVPRISGRTLVTALLLLRMVLA